MLYSGMRISDTIQLKRSAVDLETGKLLLRVMKTGAPLYVRLGEPATEALKALPVEWERFFWNGQSKLYTAIGNARKTISRVLAVAGLNGHPHRFRRHVFGVGFGEGRGPAHGATPARPHLDQNHGEALRAVRAELPENP
jgi:integrase